MRYIGFIAVLAFLALTLGCQKETRAQKEEPLVTLVDPFIGTDAHGHTFPGATCPFGMVQLSPDTRLYGWDGCSGYHYSDSVIFGFSHTHLSGTGVADYADFLFMPGRGKLRMTNGYMQEPGQGYARKFSKDDELASPGYYAVTLAPDNIRVELTATPRTGWHRISSEDDSLYLIIDLAHRDQVLESWMKIEGKTEIVGYRRSSSWAPDQYLYFCARFSRPIASCEWRNQTLGDNAKERVGLDVAAGLRFEPGTEPLIIKVGISAVDVEGARRNLDSESPGWDFEEIKQQATDLWEKELSSIIVEGGSQEDRRTFYTALYHCFIAPNLYSDVDGRYRGRDGNIHWNKDHLQYTVFSLWDTYRAVHPLFTLIQQERTRDFLITFLKQFEEGGLLPVWELAANETNCMIGYHAIPVIADAVLKGIKTERESDLLKACLASAMQDKFGIGIYREQGYLAMEDEPESVSKTLEYAYDDWCIARLAEYLGQDSIALVFDKRAQSWKNILDPESLFFRARQNGGWFTPFNPREVNFNYTEANAWQYGFYVPHDIEGFMGMLGGELALEERLDSLFAASEETTGRVQADITGLIGQYAHGNEPSHHIVYLYNFTGNPAKTQARIDEIMKKMYTDKPDGLCGNEDCGQLSAWYVFSALGFYPVTPGADYYVLGKPLFPKATIYFENGHSFTVRKQGDTDDMVFVRKVLKNGRRWPYTFIHHKKIMEGGGLVFLMDNEPSVSWGKKAETRPTSKNRAPSIVPVPYRQTGLRSFFDSTTVTLGSMEGGVNIHYTLESGGKTSATMIYQGPFTLDYPAVVKAVAVRPDGTTSAVMRAAFSRIPPGRTITITHPYSRMYTAGGDFALIDGVRGTDNFRTGLWQGYKEVDLDVTIDMINIQRVDSTVVGLLQDVGSWIFMPEYVDFQVSTDGVQFRTFKRVLSPVPQTQYGAIIRDFSSGSISQNARFVRILAKNIGDCPAWHPGFPYQGKAFIFADEVAIFPQPY